MSGDMKADIEGLERAASAFANAAKAIEKTRTEVSRAVDHRGSDAWGTDEPGGKFGDGYVPAHGQNMSNLYEIVGRLNDAVTGVNDAARLIREHDNAHARSIDGAGPGHG